MNMLIFTNSLGMEQMEDNISFMKDFQPLNDTELEAIHKVQKILPARILFPAPPAATARTAARSTSPFPTYLP